MATVKRDEPREDLTADERLLIPTVNPAYHFGAHFENIALDIKEARKVLLTGHMGCGKTSIYEQIAAKKFKPVIRANMNGQTTISDFVGFYMAKNGNTEWVDGVLPHCMRRGIWLVIDEMDFADAPILSVLNSVAEPNGKLFLKEKGYELVNPHPDFRLLATANTVGIMESCRHIYQGANLMNRALLDRFRVYHMDYLAKEDEAMVLQNTVAGVTDEVAGVLVDFAQGIRKGFEDEQLSTTFSLRQLIDFAEMMTRTHERHKDWTPNEVVMKSAAACIFSKVSKEDGEVIKGMVQRTLFSI